MEEDGVNEDTYKERVEQVALQIQQQYESERAVIEREARSSRLISEIGGAIEERYDAAEGARERFKHILVDEFQGLRNWNCCDCCAERRATLWDETTIRRFTVFRGASAVRKFLIVFEEFCGLEEGQDSTPYRVCSRRVPVDAWKALQCSDASDRAKRG